MRTENSKNKSTIELEEWAGQELSFQQVKDIKVKSSISEIKVKMEELARTNIESAEFQRSLLEEIKQLKTLVSELKQLVPLTTFNNIQNSLTR